MRLAVSLGWHVHPWEELLALVQRAESLGYDAAYVDGDVSMLDARRDTEVLDGWTVTTALLERTRRIAIGSIRLVHHWHAAHLAQAVATLERLHPGRLRLLIATGDRPADARFGLPFPSAAERLVWLDETLTALRGLWSGEDVTLNGRHVVLDGARVRPLPRGGRMPIEVAARRPRALEVVAAHADVWDVNLPALPERVARAEARLAEACRARGRDPDAIERSMWVFTRVGAEDPDAALREYRQLNPWFADIPDAELREALVLGPPARCRERLAALASELRLDHPVVDLAGLDAESSVRVLEALAPGNPHSEERLVDAGT